jgi:hypothetical protein
LDEQEITVKLGVPTLKLLTISFAPSGSLTKLAEVRIIEHPSQSMKIPVHAKNFDLSGHHNCH